MTGMELTTVVGYRFHPTDEELVKHYLRLKILGKDFEVRIIPEVDVCKYEPYELPEFSVIKSDDPEWFFFCRRDIKNSKSNRANRATKSGSGYWKATGKDRKIKARGTKVVIGTKKTLVFHTGRVPNGARTSWVMHEYHPATRPPHQRDFVLVLLKKKPDDTVDVPTRGDVEASSYTASDFESPVLDGIIPEAHFQPEQTLEFPLPGLLEWEYDFSPDMQHIFTNSHINELNGFQFQSDANEQEEDDTEFVNSLFVDQDDIFRGRAEMINQGQGEMMNFNRFREAKSLSKVYFSNGGLSSDTDTDTAEGLDSFGRACSLVRTESPPKERPFPPQNLRRSRHFAGQRAAQKRFQSKSSSLHKAATPDKARDALSEGSSVDLPQKENSSTDSNNKLKMARGTNEERSLKSTTYGSASSSWKGYFIFKETSLLRNESSPPSVYVANVIIGTFLFVVLIRELVLYGNWC